MVKNAKSALGLAPYQHNYTHINILISLFLIAQQKIKIINVSSDMGQCLKLLSKILNINFNFILESNARPTM